LPDARIAVVIPTLNEEAALERNLPRLLALEENVSVLVSDGGSEDRTAEVVERLGVALVSGSPGRGTQLNRGARAIDGDILLFLHADTTLPTGAFRSIRQAITDGAVGGGFLIAFDAGGPLLRLGERMVNLRTRVTRVPLGDQAQFVARPAFERLAGYREWPILEDLDFARRLKREGRTALIHDRVTTSARRFTERGVLRTVATNWMIWTLYLFGVSPRRLAPLYRQVR